MTFNGEHTRPEPCLPTGHGAGWISIGFLTQSSVVCDYTKRQRQKDRSRHAWKAVGREEINDGSVSWKIEKLSGPLKNFDCFLKKSSRSIRAKLKKIDVYS